jgi:hypothetical protein
MSVYPNKWVEPFPTISHSNVKDIWSESTDEIHKDLYMKLSTQAAQIAALKETCGELTKQLLDVKTEMSSLLSGDFYIHAGNSTHGKISTNSGGTNIGVGILSQDHLINCFTGYDVAVDGTVKVNCPGRDDCYPLTQRWSFERATDKLINHPDGSHRLMSIPLDKSKVPV